MNKYVIRSAVLIISLLITACSANHPIDNFKSNDMSEAITAESET